MREIENIGIEIVGITPQAKSREAEIILYLKVHPEVDNYCILDDDYEMQRLKGNLVKLPSQMKEDQKGLEEVYMNMAIDILNRNKKIK